MKKFFTLMFALVIALSFAACSKKEEAPIPGTGMPQGHPPAQQQGLVIPQGETQIVIPDDVKGKFSTVKITVEDKIANKSSDISVKLGGEYTIPDSDVTIKVTSFLPDFIMDGLTITSRSAEMNNPAVKIVVMEGGTEIFSGWLYSKFPSIHPFQHEKYSLTLIGAES